MGAVLAKFRKEKTTTEVLEALEEKIQALEKYTLNTQEQKKRFVGNFLASSIGVYVIAFIIFYFVYFPPTWNKRIIYSVPLLIFPLVIIFLRSLFTWYFQRKLNKNTSKLNVLKTEKKKILEQVMDKETYKVAVNLLARFGDKNSGYKSSFSLSPMLAPSSTSFNKSLNRSTASQLSITPSQRSFTSGLPRPTLSSTNLAVPSPPTLALSAQTRSAVELRRRRTPYPIVNQQDKGVLERIVDVLIGDGPKDRFAMICKECYSHNGMALKEEFDYATFRCAFCNALNPSRKKRPVAPRLTSLSEKTSSPRNVSDTDSSLSSDENSDNGDHNRHKVPRNKSTPASHLSARTIEGSASENLSDSTTSMDIEQRKHKHAMEVAAEHEEVESQSQIDATMNTHEKDEQKNESGIDDSSKLSDEFKKEL